MCLSVLITHRKRMNVFDWRIIDFLLTNVEITNVLLRGQEVPPSVVTLRAHKHTHTHAVLAVTEGHVSRMSGVCPWSESQYKTQAGTLNFPFSYTQLLQL